MRARPSRWTQLLAVIRKETLQTIHDRRLVMLLVFAPTVQLIVFGFAVDFKVDRVSTVVVDHDQTAASRKHLRELLADGTLSFAGQALSGEEVDYALEEKGVSAAVILPRHWSRSLERGESSPAQVILDGADSNVATVAGMAATRYFAQAQKEKLAELAKIKGRASSQPEVILAPRIWFNPGLDTPPYMIPGVIGLLLVVVTTIVTAMGLSREREIGTLEQILVTPISPWVLLLGKMLPFVVIGLVNITFALATGMWIFHVPVRGSLAVVALASVLYLMSTLGVGLLISTFSQTQQQSFLGGFLFALPAILLSGVTTPIRGMPMLMQGITWFNPVRYFVEILRANLLTGANLNLVWPQMLALFCFGAGLLTAAALRFRKRIG